MSIGLSTALHCRAQSVVYNAWAGRWAEHWVSLPGSERCVQCFPGLPKGVYSAPNTLGPPNTLGVPPNTLGHFRKKTCLFHCVLWVFAEYTRIFAEYTRFLGVLRRIHSNAKGVYSAAEYTRISPDTLESRRIHSNLAEYTRFRRIHSLAEYTRIQKLTKTYDLELANLVFLCLCTLS